MRFFVSIVFCISFLFFCEVYSGTERSKNHPKLLPIVGKDFLITVPKSGTNLTTSIIQFYTKRGYLLVGLSFEKYGLEEKYKKGMDITSNIKGLGFGRNRLDVQIDKSLPKFLRCHDVKRWNEIFFSQLDTRKNNLLMVVRNYKEIALRKANGPVKSLSSILSHLNWISELYKYNLNFFESWKGKKLLIYYEDLILYPEQEIKKILMFFNISPERSKDFMKNYDYYMKKSTQSYHKEMSLMSKGQKFEDGSFTHGKKVIYYSKKASKHCLHEIDLFMKRDFILFDKYLGRYL